MSKMQNEILAELISLEIELATEQPEKDKVMLDWRKAMLLKRTKKWLLIKSIYNLIQSWQIIFNPTER